VRFIKISCEKVKAFVFDLDYVLYDESLYYFAVFENMCSFLKLSKDKLAMMQKCYLEKRIESKDILGDILRALFLYTPELQEKFFEFYKSTYKPLPLYDDAKEVVSILRTKSYKLGIITNGVVEAQKSKVSCLGIEKVFDEILYAREFGKEFEKPHTKPYMEICRKLNVNPFKCIYIGDNPLTDFKGARKAGFTTIRLVRGIYSILPVSNDVDLEIYDLWELFVIGGA